MSKQNAITERETLLIDPDVQTMIQKMIDQGIYTVTSRLEKEGIVYPLIHELFPTKSERETTEFLERLAKAGIFKSKLLDKVIICPTCGNSSVSSKYNCPRCSSFDIGKAMIIEHIRCGFIGSMDKFQSGDALICPKCKNAVSDNDYRKIGTSFECNSCGTRFESPRVSHKCNSCEDVFTYKEARYEPLHEFELTEDTKRSVARGTLPLSSIVNTLKESGFEVGSRQELLGKSGATHNFDIVARKDSILVVANFAFEPKEEDIIALFAKKYDVNPTFTILIALTPPTKDEESVSRAYGVKIVSPTSSNPIGKQILELINASQVKAPESKGYQSQGETSAQPSAVEAQFIDNSENVNLESDTSEAPYFEKEKEQSERTDEKAANEGWDTSF